MSQGRASRVAAALVMALCLNGCVAAAIPVLAGAGILRTGTDGKDGAESEPEVIVAEPVAETTQPAEPAPQPSITSAVPPAAATPAEPEPALVGPLASLPSNAFIGPAPAPDGEVPAILQPTPYSGLLAYASKVQEGAADTAPVLSAMLRDPAALNGERRECRASIPVVLIDLDPHEGTLSPQTVSKAAPALAKGLQKLREEDVDIAWISGSSAGQAGEIREALTKSGLDPNSEDRLILMRYPGDRKQTRREELARESCVIAIAGDNRADFDELYEYLVNPEAAAGLELLVGEGWFLVPPVLGKEG